VRTHINTNTNTMRILLTLLSVIVTIAFVGCRTISGNVATKRDFTGSPSTDFTVWVTGAPGLKFTGTLVTDGAAREVSGIVPATYQVSTHELVCSFRKTGTEGDIVLRVSEGDRELGSSSNRARLGGVRAEILRTRSARSIVFTGF
jgi:hypothetical protein